MFLLILTISISIVIQTYYHWDLQLPMQSVPIITTNCEFVSRSWRGVLDTILCDKICQ